MQERLTSSNFERSAPKRTFFSVFLSLLHAPSPDFPVASFDSFAEVVVMSLEIPLVESEELRTMDLDVMFKNPRSGITTHAMCPQRVRFSPKTTATHWDVDHEDIEDPSAEEFVVQRRLAKSDVPFYEIAPRLRLCVPLPLPFRCCPIPTLTFLLIAGDLANSASSQTHNSPVNTSTGANRVRIRPPRLASRCRLSSSILEKLTSKEGDLSILIQVRRDFNDSVVSSSSDFRLTQSA